MLKLRFNDGRQDPVWVVEKNFTIGSADDNDLVIDDASVSPMHAKITMSRQTFVLKDLASSAGTWVNGKPINQHAVACRDQLKFGNVEVSIVDPSAEKLDYLWSLVACSSFLTGQEFPLYLDNDKSVVIGRGKRCDIAFPGTHLSKEHARFTATPEGLRVEDLDSENGVFVNDERTTLAYLKADDRVRLDIYNFAVFGPGIVLAKSATATPLSLPSEEDAKTKNKTKEWITRPTSPGNRSQITEPLKKSATGVYLFSALMIALLLGLTAYLFL